MKMKLIIATLCLTVGIAVGGLGMRYHLKHLKAMALEACHVAGHEEFIKKNYYKASEFYCMAIGIDFNRYEAHLALATCYKRIGLNELALEQYKLALSLIKGKDKVEAGDKKYISKQLDSLRTGTTVNK